MTRRGRPRQQWWKLVYDIRRRADLTQKQLARVIGVSQAQVSRWELAEDRPQPRHRRKLEVLTA
jgi:transcriptional regulator with XRE-family HTH domain